jgi:hypothetical protein
MTRLVGLAVIDGSHVKGVRACAYRLWRLVLTPEVVWSLDATLQCESFVNLLERFVSSELSLPSCRRFYLS